MEEKRVDDKLKLNLNGKEMEDTSKKIMKLLEEEGINPEGDANAFMPLGCVTCC